MARWEEALDVQLDVVEFWRSQRGRAFGEGYARSVRDNDPEEHALLRSVYNDMATACGTMVANSEPVWVDKDVMTIVENAQLGFKPEPLQAQDLITPAGFMLLPRPFTTKDIHGLSVSYRAIGWYPMQTRIDRPSDQRDVWIEGPLEKGVIVVMYHHLDDTDDYSERDSFLNSRAGGGTMPKWLVSHVLPWTFGREPWTEQDAVDIAEKYKREHPDSEVVSYADPNEVPRWLQTIWRIMQQTIGAVTISHSNGPRSVIRRWSRANLIAKQVTLVTLRRPRVINEKGEGSAVEWTHRWMVSGHWRWQWYAKYLADGHTPDQSVVCTHRDAAGRTCGRVGGIHRQIFIAPFIKGPDDMPLLMPKTRVLQLVR